MGIINWLFGNKIVEAPDVANESVYISRCLQADFNEQKEIRKYDSHPDFEKVLTSLNNRSYQMAIDVGNTIIPVFKDFDLVYVWVASAYNGLNDFNNSRKILMNGLAKAKRKNIILTRLGITEFNLGNISNAVYWWLQSLHCQSNKIPHSMEYTPYLYLSYVANGLDLNKLSIQLLNLFDSLGSGGSVRLSSNIENQLINLSQQNTSGALIKILNELQLKRFNANVNGWETEVLESGKQIFTFYHKGKIVGSVTLPYEDKSDYKSYCEKKLLGFYPNEGEAKQVVENSFLDKIVEYLMAHDEVQDESQYSISDLISMLKEKAIKSQGETIGADIKIERIDGNLKLTTIMNYPKTSKDTDIRWNLILAFKKIGFNSVASLITLLDENEQTVKSHASWALVEIGEAALTPLLQHYLPILEHANTAYSTIGYICKIVKQEKNRGVLSYIDKCTVKSFRVLKEFCFFSDDLENLSNFINQGIQKGSIKVINE